jgi:hypothetical protein
MRVRALAASGHRCNASTMRLDSDIDYSRAYLLLDESVEVANRLVFTHEDHREAWGIKLDFDADGRLVGIEFEDAELAPQALLTHARHS